MDSYEWNVPALYRAVVQAYDLDVDDGRSPKDPLTKSLTADGWTISYPWGGMYSGSGPCVISKDRHYIEHQGETGTISLVVCALMAKNIDMEPFSLLPGSPHRSPSDASPGSDATPC